MVVSTAPTKSDSVRLAEYLRHHPLALDMSVESVAEEAGVPIEFAQRMLTGRPSRTRSSRAAEFPRWLQSTFALFDKATNNVSLFVLVTSIGSLIIGLIAGIAAQMGPFSEAIAVLALLAVSVLHMACYFRHGQARTVLRGTAVLGGVFTLWVLATNVNELRTGSDQAVANLFALGMASAILAFLYLTFGLIVSVLGGYVIVRREETSLMRLSRQDLLERLFELDSRLQSSMDVSQEDRAIYRFEVIRDLRDAPYRWAILLGGGLGMLAAILTAQASLRQAQFSVDLRFWVLQSASLLVLVIASAAQVVLSYSCRRVSQAVLVAFVFAVASGIPFYLPFPGRGVPELNWGPQAMSLLLGLGNGLIGGLGGAIEERAARGRRLSAGDPETLLIEIVEIHRLLTPRTREVAIMVVDAAKSSLMKASADPFVAEWTFRAYQQFLEAITRQFGGAVFSTAGDGATMQFQDATSALQAADKIQRDIIDFNQTVNKLEMPFQLRIGVHIGQVRGSIEEVQFTEVIDVAAHVEAHAPVGCVAVSEPALVAAPGYSAHPIDQMVDGYRVFASCAEAAE